MQTAQVRGDLTAVRQDAVTVCDECAEQQQDKRITLVDEYDPAAYGEGCHYCGKIQEEEQQGF